MARLKIKDLLEFIEDNDIPYSYEILIESGQDALISFNLTKDIDICKENDYLILTKEPFKGQIWSDHD